MKEENNNQVQPVQEIKPGDVKIDIIMKKNFSMEFMLHVKAPANIQATVAPARKDRPYGSVIINMDNKISFTFLETLRKALADFDQNFKDAAN